jgi:TANFOR domain-containing protein
MRTPKNTNYFLLLILIFISAVRLNAQIERAVSSTTILKPPYSLYLSDYGAASSDKCAVTLVFKDFNEPSWNVCMSLTIESMYVKFETSPNFRPSAPITLTPGTPVTLTGSDLYEYFKLENLVMQGINRSELEKYGHIPEGLYKFTFNVRDYTSGKIISTASSFTANIQLADPPRVLSPKEGGVVLPKTPQLMTFQWQIQN